MLHRYILWARNTYQTENDAQILLHHEWAEDFISVLRKTFKPYSVKNHAGSVASCLELLLTDQSFRAELGLSYPSKPKIEEAKKVWITLKRTNEKEARGLQRAKMRAGTYKDVPVSTLYDFLLANDEKVDAIIKTWDSHVLIANAHDLGLVKAFCAVILALHGQRLCAGLNLTCKAVKEPSKSSGLFIVRIEHHKSSRAHGPAAIALRPQHYSVFRGLARVRMAEDGPHARLLTAPKNRAGQALLAPVEAYLSARHPGWSGLTFNSVRKCLETHSYLAHVSDVDPAKAVSSYLLHTKGVTDLHYAYRSDARIAAESRTVQDVLTQLLTMDLARTGIISVRPSE
jgi:hypothetical protein